MLDTIFESITRQDIEDYTKYWQSVTPMTEADIFRRWLFAYMSIRNTWEGNLRGYNAIKDFEQWKDNKSTLDQILSDAKCGFHNKRTEFIWHFKELYFNDPSEFKKSDDESWETFRNRLVKVCKGIGVTKVSFTLEMCYPNSAEVTCFDTHMLRLYQAPSLKWDNEKGYNVYRNIEQDWVNRSKNIGASPYVARCFFWDRNQNQQDSRYWSYVLEG